MASGKSSFGKKLAHHFDFDFIDLDTLIEEKANKSINEIFQDEGETHFRQLENDALRSLKEVDSFVATGGGTPCHSENMTWMKENGIVIFLKMPASTILGRLRQNKSARPLVKDLSDVELQEFVSETMEKRRPFYEEADITYGPDKALMQIKAELNFVIKMGSPS